MEYDVVVVGSGSGGYYSAISSAKKGLKVAIVEKEELGGTAFRWGSLGVKRILDSFRQVDEKLLEELEIDKTQIYIKKYREAIEDMKNIEVKIRHDLEKLGVDIYKGELKDGKVEIGDKELSWKNLIIATGTKGKTIWSGKRIITHKELLAMEDLPKKICIVGGNVEGIEIANITSLMGIKTTVIEMSNRILNGTSKELVEPVKRRLEINGVRLELDREVADIEELEDTAMVKLTDGTIEEYDLAIVTGIRESNIPSGIDVEVEDGYIKVDGNYETSQKGIYAIGDINGIMGMANAARYQGEQVGKILSGKKGEPYPKSLSRAIYTIPEIAVTGVDNGKRSGVGYFRDTFRGFSKGVEEGFVRVIVNEEDIIIGIAMVGDDVSEYLGIMGYLIDNRVGVEEARKIMMAHPTLIEAFIDAINSIKK